VPKYQNPMGITFSDDVVRRMANLAPAAGDFRIFWDNAYAIHDLEPGKGDRLLNLMAELKKAGKPDMALFFTSTSKISFAGAGIAAVGGSAANIGWLKQHFGLQMISGDKVNQLRHARYFQNKDGVLAHMEKQAALLRPKFDAVLDTLEQELAPAGVASWNKPRGGYFIPLDVMDGCAKRTVALCKEAGVVMTGAGATFPYGNDPRDRNIRIAPTFAGTEEVKTAATLLCLCVRLACAEKLLQQAQAAQTTGA
jgi:DNA-binding transcriptional MocR family regulator